MVTWTPVGQNGLRGLDRERLQRCFTVENVVVETDDDRLRDADRAAVRRADQFAGRLVLLLHLQRRELRGLRDGRALLARPVDDHLVGLVGGEPAVRDPRGAVRAVVAGDDGAGGVDDLDVRQPSEGGVHGDGAVGLDVGRVRRGVDRHTHALGGRDRLDVLVVATARAQRQHTRAQQGGDPHRGSSHGACPSSTLAAPVRRPPCTAVRKTPTLELRLTGRQSLTVLTDPERRSPACPNHDNLSASRIQYPHESP